MAAGSPSLGLGRERRVKQSRDFARARAGGLRQVCGCLIANWTKLPAASVSRVGVITSRKIGGAVIRNRARRLLREAFRLHQYEFREPVDLILVARASIVGKKLASVEADFRSALRRADLLKPTE